MRSMGGFLTMFRKEYGKGARFLALGGTRSAGGTHLRRINEHGRNKRKCKSDDREVR